MRFLRRARGPRPKSFFLFLVCSRALPFHPLWLPNFLLENYSLNFPAFFCIGRQSIIIIFLSHLSARASSGSTAFESFQGCPTPDLWPEFLLVGYLFFLFPSFRSKPNLLPSPDHHHSYR